MSLVKLDDNSIALWSVGMRCYIPKLNRKATITSVRSTWQNDKNQLCDALYIVQFDDGTINWEIWHRMIEPYTPLTIIQKRLTITPSL